MKPSAELFDLIKSLTASEKRYFRLNASLQKGNKNYIRLFEVIDQQEVYDEKEIKAKFRKESFVKNLTFTKNYLYKLIFRSLISVYNEKSLDARLYNILSRCRLMYDKALFPQYFKTVQYGKDMAKKYERFSILLEYLEIDRQLSKKEDLTKKNINDIYDEELLILEKIKNSNKYKRAISTLFRIYRQNGLVRSRQTESEVNNVINGEEFENINKALSITAKEKFYFALNIACEIKGNTRDAYLNNKKRFEHISNNKEVFQQFLFDNYKDSFIATIHSAAQDGNFKEAEKLYKKYKNTFYRDGETDIDSLTTYFMVSLNKAIAQKERNANDKMIYQCEKFLVGHRGKITINHYNLLYFLLAKYHFVTGNFEQALRLINTLFANKTLKFTIHIEPYARMLNVLIHSELSNNKLLNYLIPATIKYLKSKNKLYKTESAVLNALRKVNSATHIKDSESEFLRLSELMCSLKNDKYERNAIAYIDYSDWLTNKLNN